MRATLVAAVTHMNESCQVVSQKRPFILQKSPMILQKSPFTCTHLHTHMYVTRQGGTCDAAIVAKKPYHIAEEPYIILQKSPFTYTHILTHTYTHTHVARQGDACDAAIVVVAGRLCMREGRTKKGDLTHSYA